ncbi:acyl-CoA reductase [Limosilactobacillus fermentum]|nr:acyl-CoA reductase [Limosilactobacillus fermentum]CDN25665.1 acyl-CoA reductase [Limosilactobacillus fermentum]SJM55047.1 Acyl-CoA reductase [Limosilactobacillus fermentum]SJM60315.1 Acyl-CoA reductase [Limosilactobacillus fermentum]
MKRAVMGTIKVIPVDIFKMPRGITLTNFGYQTITIGQLDYSLRFPIVTPDAIVEIKDRLRHNQAAYLSHLTVAEIISKIDQAVNLWTHPDYPQRRLAMKLLPQITGYNAETVELEIKRFIRVFRKKELMRFVDSELDQPEILDDFHPQKSGSMTKAFGPETTFHVFSGNIPGLQIWSLIMATIVKSASLGKTSMSEPLFPVLFAQSLAEVSPELADCLAILPWKGGTMNLEEAATSATDATIVYGSDKAVDAIKELVPKSKIFLHYGYKISFSMIGREALTPEYYLQTVKQAIEDVAVYDQQSCLSAQTIFVEKGGSTSPMNVAKLLASELANYQLKRPRAELTNEQAAAVVRLRNDYQLKALNDSDVQVFASDGNTDWTVVYHAHPGFINSPLNRTIHVYAIDELEQVPEYLQPFKQYLQSCGLAVKPTRLFSLANQLGRAGINRISALGEMTRAKPGWHHDGHFNLLDLLRFIDVEQNTERAAEKFDPDVE